MGGRVGEMERMERHEMGGERGEEEEVERGRMEGGERGNGETRGGETSTRGGGEQSIPSGCFSSDELPVICCSLPVHSDLLLLRSLAVNNCLWFYPFFVDVNHIPD